MSHDTLRADERLRQLVDLTDALTNRIASETRAFEARRPRDVAATIAETSRLANIYRLESARLKQDQSLLEAASMASRVALIRATEAFDAVLARHGRALDAARTITEGLVHAIAKEVAAQRPKPVGYNNAARASVGDASAITLNRSA